MRWRDVVSYVTFGAICALALAYFGGLGLRVNPPAHRTNLTMDVPDINGIAVGSNVMLRGAPVGKITQLSTGVDHATIDFYVDPPFAIPVDSEVRLDNLSALGESYIDLRPRTADGPMLQNGQHLAADKVTQPPSISELATSVVRVLHQLDPGALSRIIAEADAGLPDPMVVLPNLSRTTTLLNNIVNDQNGQGRVLLGNFQALLRNAEWVNPSLTNLTPRVHTIGVGIQDLYKHLMVLYTRDNPARVIMLGNLLNRVQGLLDTSGGDLKVLGEAFQPKLNDIAATLMNLDTGQILDNFLQQVPADGVITLRVRP